MKPLLREETEVWINLHEMFRPLQKMSGFIWASERSGFRHLSIYDWQGKLLRQLTAGSDWVVEDIVGVDEENGYVYCMGNKGNWLDRHLFAVSLWGDVPEPRKITSQPGMHNVVMDKACTKFVDSYTSTQHPLRMEIRNLADGKLIRQLFESKDPEGAK